MEKMLSELSEGDIIASDGSMWIVRENRGTVNGIVCIVVEMVDHPMVRGTFVCRDENWFVHGNAREVTLN